LANLKKLLYVCEADSGGIMEYAIRILFDNYGFPSCPGARHAVDEFFRDKAEFPIVLASGQCVIIKI
jgi:hypothetical protein